MTAPESAELKKAMRQNAQMRTALQRIRAYLPPAKLAKQADKLYGIDGEEAILMAYENVLQEAKDGLKGIR